MQIQMPYLTEETFSKKKKGLLIAIEGIDGCGKSTQIKKIETFLQAQKIAHCITREPSKNEIGLLLRKYLKQKTMPPIDALLFAADRLDHCQNEIIPALQDNKIVVSDRYVLSSIAYQSIQCEPMDDSIEWIATLNRFCIAPDLIIVLDLDPNVALQRRYSETMVQNREKFEEIEFQSRLRERYLELVNCQFNGWNYVVVDASQATEKVFASIVNVFNVSIQKQYLK